jgi:DNA phosphorothioation-associated putative methyltransferase
MGSGPAIQRHRTAIGRSGLSRPVAAAISDGLLSLERTFFDYGCGRGQDVARLRALGYRADGWDPVHAPDRPQLTADVVNLGYVVNVIEDSAERAEALQAAWKLAQRLLVIAARPTWEQADTPGIPHGDGILTSKGTFQKFYAQEELRSWIESLIQERAVAAAPGVFYVFRDPADGEELRGRRLRQGGYQRALPTSALLAEAHRQELAELVVFLRSRGRLPDVEELSSGTVLIDTFGSIGRAASVVKKRLPAADLQIAQEQARGTVLVHLALAAFRGRPLFRDLPRSLQLDIRAHFGSYETARREADDLLFAVAKRDRLEDAIATMTFGKRLPDAVYLHAAGLAVAPPLMRVYEGCAAVLVGHVEAANMLKLSRADRKVTYLAYPSFDKEAHPPLAVSLRCDLRSLDVRLRDFQGYANTPILHRKELMVPSDYPGREKFAALTRQEERAGLLGAPGIGNRDGWHKQLAAAGLAVRGHRLVRDKRPTIA